MLALEASTFQKRPAYKYLRESDKLPTIDEARTTKFEELTAKVKLFDPTGSWTWYVVAYDPETRTGYGLVDGWEKEVGTCSMEELVAIRGGFGLPIERDLYWKPAKLTGLMGGLLANPVES